MKVYTLIDHLSRKFKPNDEVVIDLAKDIKDVKRVKVDNEKMLVYKAVLVTTDTNE